jgi:hypothetical protein
VQGSLGRTRARHDPTLDFELRKPAVGRRDNHVGGEH